MRRAMRMLLQHCCVLLRLCVVQDLSDCWQAALAVLLHKAVVVVVIVLHGRMALRVLAGFEFPPCILLLCRDCMPKLI